MPCSSNKNKRNITPASLAFKQILLANAFCKLAEVSRDERYYVKDIRDSGSRCAVPIDAFARPLESISVDIIKVAKQNNIENSLSYKFVSKGDLLLKKFYVLAGLHGQYDTY